MKNIVKLLVCGLAALCCACSEDDLTGEWSYSGPIPAIKDGPTEADLCQEQVCLAECNDFVYNRAYRLRAFPPDGGDVPDSSGGVCPSERRHGGCHRVFEHDETGEIQDRGIRGVESIGLYTGNLVGLHRC